MPVIRVVTIVEVDGNKIDALSNVRRLTVAEGQMFDYVKAIGGATALPLDQIGTAVSVLIVRPDTLVTLALGQIKINPGGMLLVVDGDLGTGAQATIANATAGSAQVKGYGGGS